MLTIGDIAHQFQSVLDTGKEYLWLTGGICAVLVVVHIVNLILGKRLFLLGILPRHPLGLPGVIFSPFLHQDSTHLVFNMIPLFCLMNLVLLLGLKQFILISAILIVLTGVLIWLFGRPALHIGASAVVIAYWSFMLIYAFTSFTVVSVITAVICVYYFGSLVFSLVPAEEGVSWEGHLMGFIAGIALGYVWFIEESGVLKKALQVALNAHLNIG